MLGTNCDTRSANFSLASSRLSACTDRPEPFLSSPVVTMTDLQLSINDENTSDNGRYPASIAGSSEHTSPQHSSSSRHLQKYNDELYRSLVQESPPHNLAHGTPASEERLTKISRSTPLSSYITGSPAKPAVADEGYARQEEHQGEYRTARDWDEIMTRKRTLAQGEKKKLRDGGDQDRKVQQQQSTSIKAQPAELPSYMRVTASFESRTNREGLEYRAAHTNDHPKPITVPVCPYRRESCLVSAIKLTCSSLESRLKIAQTYFPVDY